MCKEAGVEFIPSQKNRKKNPRNGRKHTCFDLAMARLHEDRKKELGEEKTRKSAKKGGGQG